MTKRLLSAAVLIFVASLLTLPGTAQLMQPLPEDRGAAALSQQLKRLQTWGSLMAINAHPDDEDGAMLTYESRGLGVRTMLLSLTRGEGGQNAISADSYDALGLLRTQELARAAAYYGAELRWGTVADFGFSKTQQESFTQWGHDRVLCDAVAAIRHFRPLVITSSFVGGTTDGHGHHQVAGEIAQEVFNAAGDAKVCPQLYLPLWQPLKVYARVPTFSITPKGMFDYATGQWAPVLFKNYLSGEEMYAAPAINVAIHSGAVDPVLGRSYAQIAREGWDQQRTQNGGGFLALPGDVSSEYHLYASRVGATTAQEKTFFDGIDTTIPGMAMLFNNPPDWMVKGLAKIAKETTAAQSEYQPQAPEKIAPHLEAAFVTVQEMLHQSISAALRLPAKDKSIYEYLNINQELLNKQSQLNDALALALNLDVSAWVTASKDDTLRPSYDEAPRTLLPGQKVSIRIHATASPDPMVSFKGTTLTVPSEWNEVSNSNKPDDKLSLQIPEAAQPTTPYFHRDNIETPYYDLSEEALRGESWKPYPLQVATSWIYDGGKISAPHPEGAISIAQPGIQITVTRTVITTERVNGEGMVLEPAVIAPALSLSVTPTASFVITSFLMNGRELPIPVTVHLHAENTLKGEVHLNLPTGWTSTPAKQAFTLNQDADIQFKVEYTFRSTDQLLRIQAEAVSAGHSYTSSFERIGYPGLTPTYRLIPAEARLRSIDLKLPAERTIGYVMGTGDELPASLTALGFDVHLLSASDLATTDLSRYASILIGIRAYSNRADLRQQHSHLMDYVQQGGNLVVEYQSEDFPAPYPLALGRSPEKVVEESAPVKLLDPASLLLTTPNQITAADFNGWVEERGHSFLASWDNHYTALTETADAGQAPQRGGLVTTQYGKGRYIYVAYALYRQLPELVPGACRLLVNLLNPNK